MNILFLTMNVFTDIDMHNIYSDLMKEFISHGHRPYIVTPREKRTGEATQLCNFSDHSILKIRIGNTSNVSMIEKGLSTVRLSRQYFSAIKKHLGTIQFDLILYSTPPITLANPVNKLKKHYGCRTYLMLKDIFPQNAVDLGMMRTSGVKSVIYKYFRNQEKKLYAISDRIGCMSQANMDYLKSMNSALSHNKIEICANAIIPHELIDRTIAKSELRKKYNIPDTATVYLYGGNLGKPQGIKQLVACLRENENKGDRYFVICGSGSEYGVIDAYIHESNPQNVRLINFLPKNEYDALAAGCDVGLIFLDHRFTIPNYPSRILSYMENEMPVVVCSDDVTDVGTDAEKGGYGYCSSSGDTASFTAAIDKMCAADHSAMGKAARTYLEEHFSVADCYKAIMNGCVPL